MILLPNIKINIGLYITGKRPDGYHNIESVFYPVAWTEVLEVTDQIEENWESSQVVSRVESGEVRFMSYGLDIPGNASNNLCVKVYQRLEEWYNLPPIDIHLLKTIPIGAGLGGGSADAAFTLKALKDFFSLTISDTEAMNILAEIGSDCPFFWKNKPMFVFSRGEQMRPIALDLSEYHILLVNPGIHISTKEAYEGVEPKQPPIDLSLITTLEVSDWKEVVYNDFERSLFPKYAVLEGLKSSLYEKGAIYASMTGSGSTMYGIFRNEPVIPEEWSHYSTWKGKLIP